MNVLVVYDIAGRLDHLQMALRHTRHAGVGAIFVLGNIVAGTARRAAAEMRSRDGGLPAEAQAAVRQEAEQDRATYARAVALLASAGVPVYVIPGEYDAPITALKEAISSYPGKALLTFVHRGASLLAEMDVVVGFGGHLTTAAGDDQLLLRPPTWEIKMLFQHLQAFNYTFQHARRRIFLLSAPPHAEKIDRIDGEHVGLQAINQIDRQYRPHLVCCGGPATGRGVEVIDGVTVVNPGSLAEGSFALVDLDRLTARLERLVEPVGEHGVEFQSILVALDDSSEAWHALELAAGLARGNWSRLTLLHAFESVPRALGDPFLSDIIAERFVQAEPLLDQAAAYVADLDPDLDVVEGPAADAILRVAAARNVDLIVMGARSWGTVRVALGSVSSRVAHHAVCPVLIARGGPTSPVLADRAMYHEVPVAVGQTNER